MLFERSYISCWYLWDLLSLHECAVNFLNSRACVRACVCVCVISWGVWEGADDITCLFACVVDFVIPLRVFASR
jgi:hypothetical protein